MRTRDADDDVTETGDVGFPQAVILVAAVADLAFTLAVAVHVAFYDVVGLATVALVIASALVFVAATVTALAAKRKSVVTIAVALVALAGVAEAAAAVDGGSHYRALRRQGIHADAVQDRRVGGAMLSTVSAALAAGLALPLAGYLAYGLPRADRVP